MSINWAIQVEEKDKIIKDLEQKLAGYINMRDELIDMIRIKDEKLAESEEMLKGMIELNDRNCQRAMIKEKEFYDHCARYNGLEQKLSEALALLNELDSGAVKYYDQTYSKTEWSKCCNGRECGCQGMPCDPEYYIWRDLMKVREFLNRNKPSNAETI